MLDRAKAIKDELVENRRVIHKFAEIGFNLPQTTSFVMRKLEEYGYTPQIIGRSGIVCTAGKAGKTFLLRADMDALPMPEETGFEFQSDTGNSHSCGHDAHTAMLLGAARLIKECENELSGRVKFMFQPAEEILAGAIAMVEEGVLENPTVDAAMALHIQAGNEASDTGVIYYKSGPLTFSADAIKITVTGQDAHGSTPYIGIDAIGIAAHIVLGLQNIVDKEIAASDQAVVLVGKILGGTAPNTVAGSTELFLSVRSITQATRDFLKKRITEIAENIALTFRGKATVDFLYGIGPLYNNPDLCTELGEYCSNLLGSDNVRLLPKFNGSEDFCAISENVPGALFCIGVGSKEQGYAESLHSPALNINEDALPVGAAVYASCAVNWLKNNQ